MMAVIPWESSKFDMYILISNSRFRYVVDLSSVCSRLSNNF
jgi:hypothetical protein